MAPSAASDYSKKKNAELEELLKARGLAHTGKKAELIARLQADDAAKGAAASQSASNVPSASTSIPPSQPPSSSTAPPTTSTNGAGGLIQAPNPAAVPNQAPAIDPAATSDLSVAQPDTSAATSADQAAAPAESYSSNLAATSVDDELAKRRKRAERFGIPSTATADTTKALERLKRFGDGGSGEDTNATNGDGSAIRGLDAALPERAGRKRGRAGKDDGSGAGAGAIKRQNSRPNPSGTGAGAAAGQAVRAGSETAPSRPRPSKEQLEKDRLAAEARKQRFAAPAQTA